MAGIQGKVKELGLVNEEVKHVDAANDVEVKSLSDDLNKLANNMYAGSKVDDIEPIDIIYAKAFRYISLTRDYTKECDMKFIDDATKDAMNLVLENIVLSDTLLSRKEKLEPIAKALYKKIKHRKYNFVIENGIGKLSGNGKELILKGFDKLKTINPLEKKVIVL